MVSLSKLMMSDCLVRIMLRHSLPFIFCFALVSCGGGGGGSSSSTAPPQPSVSIQVNSEALVVGSSLAVTWSSNNATACSASGAWSGSKGVSGSETVTVEAVGDATFTLTCSGAGGSASRSLIITVLPELEITLSDLVETQEEDTRGVYAVSVEFNREPLETPTLRLLEDAKNGSVTIDGLTLLHARRKLLWRRIIHLQPSSRGIDRLMLQALYLSLP